MTFLSLLPDGFLNERFGHTIVLWREERESTTQAKKNVSLTSYDRFKRFLKSLQKNFLVLASMDLTSWASICGSSLKDAKEQEICPEKFEWWQIECKGSGDGKQSTQRNNFDRGVASVVSYYGPSPTEFRNFKPHLGFALPNTEYFKDLLKTRLKRPLRTRLDLWVLVYDSDDKSVHAVPPDAEYT